MTVRMDRRAEVFEVLRAELRSLQASVQGLVVEFESADAVESARDDGKFRDFVDVARVEHEAEAVLNWLAEELVDEFGWLVDISQQRAGRDDDV